MAQNSIKIGSWRLSWPILSLSWAVLGLSWPVMGLSWLVLGLSWPALGLSWVCLGPVLACLRSTLACLGPFLGCLGLPWSVLGLSWPAARLSSNIFQHCAVRNCCNTCLLLCSFCVLVSFQVLWASLSCRAWANTFLYTWRMNCCRKLMLVFTCWFSFLPCSAAVRAQHIRRLPKGEPCVPDNYSLISSFACL